MTRESRLAADGKGNPARHICLDEAGHNVHGRALRSDDQMDTDGPRFGRQATDRRFHVVGRKHHEIGQLVNDQHEIGQRRRAGLVAVNMVGERVIVGLDIAVAGILEQAIAALHLLHRPQQDLGRLRKLDDYGIAEVGDTLVLHQLDHLRINHQEL